MCFYLLDVQTPKKLQFFFTISENPQKISLNTSMLFMITRQGAIKYSRYWKQPYHVLLHDTAANDSSPSGQINQKSYSLSHQVLKILFSKFHYIPALLSAHGKNRGEPCVSCPLSIQNQLWCHPVPSFPGLFHPSIHPEVPEATGYALSCSG